MLLFVMLRTDFYFWHCRRILHISFHARIRFVLVTTYFACRIYLSKYFFLIEPHYGFRPKWRYVQVVFSLSSLHDICSFINALSSQTAQPSPDATHFHSRPPTLFDSATIRRTQSSYRSMVHLDRGLTISLRSLCLSRSHFCELRCVQRNSLSIDRIYNLYCTSGRDTNPFSYLNECFDALS